MHTHEKNFLNTGMYFCLDKNPHGGVVFRASVRFGFKMMKINIQNENKSGKPKRFVDAARNDMNVVKLMKKDAMDR